MKNNKITIYSTPTCQYCVSAKDYFKQKNLPFEDIDVSRDRVRAQEMVRKSGQMGVPVVEINGTILVGFQPKAFDSLIK